jgi:simple sugar transport system ATP-binding protein
VSQPPRLALSGITKRYQAVVANDDVALAVAPGEIHAVLGENGAGKSTLMKIIYGVVRPDAGTIRFNGAPLAVRSPQDALAHGIAMVFQHFSLFDTLSVAENVWLGLRSVGRLETIRAGIRAKSGEYGLELDPDRPVHTLSVGERQRVEIMRALLAEPQLLILDEPTSVLTPQAVQALFVTLRKLASTGCSILYISHKLDEIRQLCDRCTVMRGGRVTGVVDPRVETNASLSRLMIGAEPPAIQHRPAQKGAVALAVHELTLPRAERFGVDLERVSLEVCAGEIVGVAGVSGNGQQELLAALSGEDTRASAESIRLFGTPVGRAGPGRRRALGLHFVPEERLGRGAVPPQSLAENLLLTRAGPETVGRAGFIRREGLAATSRRIIDRFAVKTAGTGAAARSLSGGNLQKYLMGREIDAEPKVLIVAQPTWGVDVGAAAQIRQALIALRDRGCAVLVVSEELDELFEISDRLVVIARGRVLPPVAAGDATVERIGEWMSGLFGDAEEPAPAPAGGKGTKGALDAAA